MVGNDEVSDFYCRQKLNARPPDTQNCCSFKWKSRWSAVIYNWLFFYSVIMLIIPFQCSTTCGPGIRKRHPVCLKFHPRFANVMPIRKRGTIVGDNLCDASKIPLIKQRQKRCSKPCIAPKWHPSSWSKVKLINTIWIRLSITLFMFCIVQCWMWQRLHASACQVYDWQTGGEWWAMLERTETQEIGAMRQQSRLWVARRRLEKCKLFFILIIFIYILRLL